jgi:hypothetical protein
VDVFNLSARRLLADVIAKLEEVYIPHRTEQVLKQQAIARKRAEQEAKRKGRR